MKFEKSQSDTIMVLSMVLSETCNILITSYIPLQFQTLQNKTEGVLFDNYTLIYSVISWLTIHLVGPNIGQHTFST